MKATELTQAGTYDYKLPDWRYPAIVTVERDEDDNLVVRFDDDYTPVPARDIPETAEFTLRDS